MKLEDITDVKELQEMARKLWGLLDDIDTLDDACREHDGMYRNAVRIRQKQRHLVLTSLDGYTLEKPAT